MRTRSCVIVLVLSFLSACSAGRGGLVPFVQNPASGNSVRTSAALPTANVSVKFSFKRWAPVLLKSDVRSMALRRRPNALSFDHLSVKGVLSPSDAAAYEITNTIDVAAPSGGTYSASVPFSNVPIHNNQWIILTFTGVAKDGSRIDLGQLAGLINVAGKTATSATLTPKTTRTFQLFANLLANHVLGTYDIDNAAGLAGALTTAIGSTPFDQTTQLFNAPTLEKLYNAALPTYRRTITVSTAPVVKGAVTISIDYTNESELMLAAQHSAPFWEELNVHGVTDAGICAMMDVSFVPNAPPNMVPNPHDVHSCAIANPTGSVKIANVYGGHLIVGASDGTYTGASPMTPPFKGGFVKLDGRAAGTANVNVATATTQSTIAVDDPAGFAFGWNYEAQMFRVATDFPSNLAHTFFGLPYFNGSMERIYVPTNYGASHAQITVDTTNPFGIAPANLQICGGVSCQPFDAGTTLHVKRPFGDRGTNLSYFDWKAGGVATGISGSSGYDVTLSGAGNGTLTSTRATVLTPNQSVLVFNNLPPGTVWTITAVTAKGTYVNSGTNEGSGYATIVMNSVPSTVDVTSIKLGFNAPTGGTFTMSAISHL